jgi:phenylacetate-coenzyme A ligase PaaK-like adenylate-forming protein
MGSPTESPLSTAPFYDVTTLDPEIVRRRTDEIAERLTWPRERILGYQQDRLREMLRHAASASPHFRENIGHLVTADAPLSAYPIMNKTVLMEEFDRIVTDPRLTRTLVEQHAGTRNAGHLLLDEYRVASTGGSSGQRAVFVYDQNAWVLTIANLRRMQRFMGLPPSATGLGIGAPSPVHLSNRVSAEARVGLPDAPRLSVTTPIEKVVEALNRFRPDVIITYPSFIRRLAEEQSAGRLKIAPMAMRSIAEVLSPDVRALARATWNIPVTNSYASTEAGIMGMECRHLNGIHLCEDMIVVEIVDDSNQPVPVGTAGSKALVTTLFNWTLPIIRYEFSDILTAIDGPCPCGCPFRRIKDIEGRREEMLHVWLPDGRQVDVHAPRLWFHLVQVPGVRQYQFAQLTKGIAVRIVPTPGHDPEAVRGSVDRIAKAALTELGALEGYIEVRIVDGIERTGAGAKQKLVASAPTTH